MQQQGKISKLSKVGLSSGSSFRIGSEISFMTPLVNRKNSQFIDQFKLDDDNKSNIKIKTMSLYKTKAGINNGKPKTNQDSYLCSVNGLNIEGFNLYSVMDGHGTHGHFISGIVKTYIKDYIFKSSNYDDLSILGIAKRLKEKNFDLIKKCFQSCESSLAKSKYEVNFSGSTTVLVIQIDNLLICANAGDSRAILCSTNGKIIALSNDHKPELKSEKERILASGGRVERLKDGKEYVGPYRVWLKYEDFPGLAMSRSLGDFVSKSVGCSCIPDIIESNIDEYTEFLVIASDGVWEFLDNKQVYDIVEPYYLNNDIQGACSKLIEESAMMWRRVSLYIVYNILYIIIYRKMMVKMI